MNIYDVTWEGKHYLMRGDLLDLPTDLAVFLFNQGTRGIDENVIGNLMFHKGWNVDDGTIVVNRDMVKLILRHDENVKLWPK